MDWYGCGLLEAEWADPLEGVGDGWLFIIQVTLPFMAMPMLFTGELLIGGVVPIIICWFDWLFGWLAWHWLGPMLEPFKGVELGAIMFCCCCCVWLTLRDAELTPTPLLLFPLPFIIKLPLFALKVDFWKLWLWWGKELGLGPQVEADAREEEEEEEEQEAPVELSWLKRWAAPFWRPTGEPRECGCGDCCWCCWLWL